MGNGVVAGTYNNGGVACVATVESCIWWDHLRRSGFVAGSGVAQPLNAVAGLIGVQTGDNATPGPAIGPVLGIGAGGPGGFFGLMICSANLPDKIAIASDTQMDDGVRTAGSVRGILQTAPNPPIPADADAAAGNYVETGTNSYTLCRML